MRENRSLNGSRDPLTDRQLQVLTFIKSYIARYRMPPTINEIGEEFCIYNQAVRDHVMAIQRKGWLIVRRHYGTSGKAGSMTRGIVVL